VVQGQGLVSWFSRTRTCGPRTRTRTCKLVLEDKDLWSVDKDKDLQTGPRWQGLVVLGQGLVSWSSRTRAFPEDNNTGR